MIEIYGWTVLLDTLRREGFKLGVGPPRVVLHSNPDYSLSVLIMEVPKMLEEVTVLVEVEYAWMGWWRN